MAASKRSKASTSSKTRPQSIKRQSRRMIRTAPLPDITFSNHTWGGLFTGTKASLIAAGLAENQHFPRHGRHSSPVGSYWLPLNWQAHVGAIKPRSAAISPNLDSHDLFEIHVRYNEVDLDVGPRGEAALQELGRLFARVSVAMQKIAPPPMNELIAVRPAVRVVEAP